MIVVFILLGIAIFMILGMGYEIFHESRPKDQKLKPKEHDWNISKEPESDNGTVYIAIYLQNKKYDERYPNTDKHLRKFMGRAKYNDIEGLAALQAKAEDVQHTVEST